MKEKEFKELINNPQFHPNFIELHHRGDVISVLYDGDYITQFARSLEHSFCEYESWLEQSKGHTATIDGQVVKVSSEFLEDVREVSEDSPGHVIVIDKVWHVRIDLPTYNTLKEANDL